MTAGRIATVALVAAAATLTACGLAPRGGSDAGTTLLVTRDFGTRTLTSGRAPAPRRGETALDLLQAGAAVTVAPDGSIDSIDGIPARGRNRWSYWVNGTQATVRPQSYALSPGDVVQFDYADAPGATTIVGAYPNPFVFGAGGKRLPVHVECESDSSAACSEVRTRLADAGVVPAASEIGSSAGPGTLRVVVARWSAIRTLTTIGVLALGPRHSGVFARFGSRLELLDAAGRVARSAPPGSGLVAALAPPSNAVAWLVTGVDEAGVDAAARALDARRLAGAFAVAATPAGLVRLPVRG